MIAPTHGHPAAHGHEERVIAQIWADLLGAAEPHPDANFFDMGGHSLAVARLANRIEDAFGLSVPLADLFAHPTVAAQASLVERLYEEELTDLIDAGDDEDGYFVDAATT